MTESNGNVRNLTGQELQAIQLKYEGRSNLEISEKVGGSINTIEHWFGSQGRLSREYNDFLDLLACKRYNSPNYG